MTKINKWPKCMKWWNGLSEGQRFLRFAFGRRSALFCVPVLFLYLCLLWVCVFFGFYVGPAKLQHGATPPSVMVLFFQKHLFPWTKNWNRIGDAKGPGWIFRTKTMIDNKLHELLPLRTTWEAKNLVHNKSVRLAALYYLALGGIFSESQLQTQDGWPSAINSAAPRLPWLPL